MKQAEKIFLQQLAEQAKSRLNMWATLRFRHYVTPERVLALLEENAALQEQGA